MRAGGGSWKDGGYPCNGANVGKQVLTSKGVNPSSKAYGFLSSVDEGPPHKDLYECTCIGKSHL